MMDEDVKKLVRSLRESARTFERNTTHALPAMESFVKRHIKELRMAANELEHSIGADS